MKNPLTSALVLYATFSLLSFSKNAPLLFFFPIKKKGSRFAIIANFRDFFRFAIKKARLLKDIWDSQMSFKRRPIFDLRSKKSAIWRLWAVEPVELRTSRAPRKVGTSPIAPPPEGAFTIDEICTLQMSGNPGPSKCAFWKHPICWEAWPECMDAKLLALTCIEPKVRWGKYNVFLTFWRSAEVGGLCV